MMEEKNHSIIDTFRLPTHKTSVKMKFCGKLKNNSLKIPTVNESRFCFSFHKHNIFLGISQHRKKHEMWWPHSRRFDVIKKIYIKITFNFVVFFISSSEWPKKCVRWKDETIINLKLYPIEMNFEGDFSSLITHVELKKLNDFVCRCRK